VQACSGENSKVVHRVRGLRGGWWKVDLYAALGSASLSSRRDRTEEHSYRPSYAVMVHRYLLT
jgi:hypothetical protein